jgi:hypothetical protein
VNLDAFPVAKSYQGYAKHVRPEELIPDKEKYFFLGQFIMSQDYQDLA